MDSNLNLDILPPEVVTQFLLRLSLKDLANYCQTSKTANEYCESDAFWKDKYRHDFGLPLPKNPTKLWINLYKERMRKNSPISVGNRHYAAIDDQGILYMGGDNMLNQLGDGTKNNSEIPIAIKSFSQKVISVSCGNLFTMSITEDGKTYEWGDLNNISSPIQIPTLNPVLINYKATKVSCGGDGWGVILDDGSIYVSIDISISGKPINTPFRVVLEDEIIDISVHASHFAVVTRSGKLYFAGEKFNDRPSARKDFIGIEISGNERIIKPKHIPFPPQQGIIPKIKQVSITGASVMALTDDGKVFIWGDNDFGFLGLPYHRRFLDKSNLHLSPQLLTTLPKISYISAFSDGSVAITTDGRLYIWGGDRIIYILSNFRPDDERFSSDSGQRVAVVPIEIDIGSRVNYIALGGFFTIAITVDGMFNYLSDDPESNS